VQNESYLFDLVGNVTQRQNNRLGLTEDFYYDNLYRLDYSNLANGSGTTQNLDMTYQDAFGNIQSKTETGYTAPAVDQTIDWTSFNYPKRITATVLGGTQQIASFAYGPDRQRWRMVYESGSTTETTLYIGGLMEKVAVGTATDYRHYIYAGGSLTAIYSRQSSGTNTVRYVLEDHQGSVASILTGTSAVNESFTAYGNRRDATTWSNPPSAADLQSMNGITRQGYTGHTALGSMGLNHMNGRVQDAITGTFLSPDPYVTQPGNTQGFNRYAYVHNNPLTFIDPSGFELDLKMCWMPPSSYGGTHVFMGPDGPVEGPVALGGAERCTYVAMPSFGPAGPGGESGGGGFSVSMPTLAGIDIRYPECEAFDAYMNQKRQRKEELDQIREALKKADMSETAITGILKAAAALPLDAKLVGVTNANSWVWLHPSANAGPVMMPSYVHQTMNSMVRSGATSGLRYVSYVGVPLSIGQISYEYSQGNYEGMIYNSFDAAITTAAIYSSGAAGAIGALLYKGAGGTEKLHEVMTPGALLRGCAIASGMYRP
jgi:RHS repeat-associated protein